MSKHGKPASVLIAWGLYDWAHAAFATIITTFIFSSYFTQAIADNPIIGTALWGHAVALSGLVIAVLSPFLGVIADKQGRRKPWIFFFTLLTAVCAALLWFSKPSSEYVRWTLACVINGTIAYELAYVFYNAMMHGLVKKQYLGRLSGLAWGFGYAGGVISLILALMLIQGGGEWFNLNIKEAEQLRLCGPLVGIWLLIFSLPLFLKVPDQRKNEITMKAAVVEGCSFFLKNLAKLRGYKQVGLFLVARMLFIDGLNTLFAFGGIYAAGVFKLSPADIVKFGIAMNISAGLGAIVFAWLDDIIGSKNVMLIGLVCLIVGLTSILLVESIAWFWVFSLFVSLFVGPIQAASRTFMVHITPRERMSEFFGLFALSGKVTAFMGPWLVGTVTILFASQRIGMGSILIFLIGGMMLLMLVKNPLASTEARHDNAITQ